MLGWGANFRNSFIGNRVAEGNHVWNYATKPNPIDNPEEWPYVAPTTPRMKIKRKFRMVFGRRAWKHV